MTETTQQREAALVQDVPGPVLYLRSLIRPVVTLAAVGVFLWMALHPAVYPLDRCQQVFILTMTTAAFWFGEKVITRTGLVDVLGKRSDG